MPGRSDDDPSLEDLPQLPLAEAPARPGEATLVGLLGERYRLAERLGSGAFGEVYRAHDVVLGRDVAIKRVRLEAFVEPAQLAEVKSRFLREAQVAAGLRHPNIVTTHDIVASERASFIVMELLQGETLQELLRRRGRLSAQDTAAILAQVAAALDHAHVQRVVHRDVKPANIMVEPSGHVKVMDFGIAKADSGANLTATGLIMGTPNYMSPEQARGGKVDARSDLFSLGCVLYECLTGVRPFEADSVTAILVRILTEEAPPVDLAATGLPSGVQALVRRAMAKDPGARFGSACEMLDALRAVSEGRSLPEAPTPGVRARRGAPGAATVVARPPQPGSSRGSTPRALLAAGVGVALFVLAAGVWLQLDPYARPRSGPRGGTDLVAEEPRGWLERLLHRRPQLRVTIPAGTTLRLALGTPVSSANAEPGAPVEATLSSPLRIEDIEAVPRGGRAWGRVTYASPAARSAGRGELTLAFDAIEISGERLTVRTWPLAMRAPAPPRRRLRKSNALLEGLADVGDAVGDLVGRIKGADASVEGGSAGTVTVASAYGQEVTLPAQASLSVRLAEAITIRRPRP